jgi:hypothetical protein
MNRRELLVSAGATGALLATGAVAQATRLHQVIMLIRHAEKPTSTSTPYGVTFDGVVDPHALIVDGWNRAGALVELFAPAKGALRSGLARPDIVFATRPGPANESLRPLETVTPLAQRLHAPVKQTFAFGQEAELAAALLATPGVSLTAWQHQRIPLITQKLGLAGPRVPSVWPGDRFDMVFVFTRIGKTWSFAQVPQLVLAGDSATPFPHVSNSGTPD